MKVVWSSKFINKSINMKSIYLLFITFASLASCGTDSTAQTGVKSLIAKEIQSSGNAKDAEVLELEMIDKITKEDSMLLLNSSLAAINEGYSRKINQLKASAGLLAKAQENLYYENSSKVNPYYKDECDKRISEMKAICSEINLFSSGLEPNYEHIFRAYSSLQKRESSQVVAKLYKAKLTYYKKASYNGYGQAGGEGQKTEIKYFLLDGTETRIVVKRSSMDEFSIPTEAQVKLFRFDTYKVDDQGIISKLN
jgi:hypothetical protein